MKEAEDFRLECANIEQLILSIAVDEFDQSTGFKNWSINQILRHLHVWNRAAFFSLTDEAAFNDYIAQAMGAVRTGGLTNFEEDYLHGLSGAELFDVWREFYPEMADAFAKADPKARLPWAGPSMSARSSVTARLMESWAHAQAIYDVQGLDRSSTDGIENVVVLGLNTYGWTFKNRKLDVPETRPSLRLTAPSGVVWEFGDLAEGELIEGHAEEFCQVVTQTRNIEDTDLSVTGPNAQNWMRIAQCFAGPPEDPPAAGVRRKKES